MSGWEGHRVRDREVAAKALRLAKGGGASDAVSIVRTTDWRMIRFANNSVTASKRTSETSLSLFLMMRERRASLTTTNLSARSLEEIVRNALGMAKLSSPSDVYAPLPRGPFKYGKGPLSRGDSEIRSERMPGAVKVAMEAAASAGAVKVAGTLTAERVSKSLCTTGGAEGISASTSYDLSVRAFADSEATGQFAQVATQFEGLRPEEVGRRAGGIAKEAMSPKRAEPGRYDALIGPMTVADLLEEVAFSASAFNVDAGSSFLTDRLGQEVAPSSFGLDDDPRDEGAPGSAPFDDEGLPTFRKAIIEDGILRTYLHNSLTARKMGARSTANAGLFRPRAYNLKVRAGDRSISDLISLVDEGIYITNNWYLRYQDTRKGDFSTILRDGLFKIEGGEIAGPIRGLRLSDNMMRLLGNIRAIGAERHWIKWWEVDIPTLAPAMLVGGANFTGPTL
jgi:PmbA protein